MKDGLSHLQNRYLGLKKESIFDKCKQLPNITEAQIMCMREILAATGRKISSGNRYSEDWIMVLPLPTPETIHGYMSIVNARCGFDDKFFELLKQRIETKKPSERHRILLIDEISLREAISMCSSTLTYKGLTDFGEKKIATTGIIEKATHGLVLMIKAITNEYAYPIAVFASKGPVRGTELSKIVLNAIILLEKAKVWVHAVVSDGPQTNRKT